MPAEIEFECPHCEEVMTVSASKAGNKGRCRNCQEWVRVPRSQGRVVQREVIREVVRHDESVAWGCFSVLIKIGLAIIGIIFLMFVIGSFMQA